jgi:hypothetical protein
LMGVLGAVLSVPVAAAISVIVDEIRSERLSPSIDAEDLVSDDLLPKEGIVGQLNAPPELDETGRPA